MESFCTLIKGDTPVFVMFYATWCPHCQKMLPIVRKLGNNSGLVLKCYDIDDIHNKRLVEYYHIETIPFMIFYRAGEPLWKTTGEIEEKELLKAVVRLLKEEIGGKLKCS